MSLYGSPHGRIDCVLLGDSVQVLVMSASSFLFVLLFPYRIPSQPYARDGNQQVPIVPAPYGSTSKEISQFLYRISSIYLFLFRAHSDRVQGFRACACGLSLICTT